MSVAHQVVQHLQPAMLAKGEGGQCQSRIRLYLIYDMRHFGKISVQPGCVLQATM